MGAALMLLGELGFVGIFIGGGAFADLQWMAPPYHYSDVPEWGALLSNVRRYTLSYPWMAFYPSLAFFVAILGFNLFGEGMRRLVETIGVGVTRLLNRYTLVAAVLLVVGAGWVRGNTGATAFYRRHAEAFDGDWAYEHVKALSHPVFEGRALGTEGLNAAAYHIAGQFETLGLQPAGEAMTYFQTEERSFQLLDAVPTLVVEDDGWPLQYRRDFVEYPSFVHNLGQGRGDVRVLMLGPLTESGALFHTYKAVEGLDFSGDIVLLLSESDLEHVRYKDSEGILIVAEDAGDLRRRHTLSTRRRQWQKPTLWISESTADRLLRETGYTVAELREVDQDLEQNQVFDRPTGVVASMAVHGLVRERVPVLQVIGHLPGGAGHIEGAPQADTAKLDHEMILVMAQYDAPPPTPDDARYPAANDNGSALGVMFEVVRAMHESGYQPYRTFLFVAYSGEGLEGGEWVYPPDPEEFLRAKRGFSQSFDLEAVVDLRGLGAGAGDGLVISAGGSLRLAELFERAADQVGVQTHRGGEPIDIGIVFEEKELGEKGQDVSNVGLSWEGWEATSRTPADTVASVSSDKLEEAGRALTLSLMILGRERQY
jgi:hypothetical protein